jgi:hypothetical protein
VWKKSDIEQVMQVLARHLPGHEDRLRLCTDLCNDVWTTNHDLLEVLSALKEQAEKDFLSTTSPTR